jgi:uncharacterized protein (TIGR02246 family)
MPTEAAPLVLKDGPPPVFAACRIAAVLTRGTQSSLLDAACDHKTIGGILPRAVIGVLIAVAIVTAQEHDEADKRAIGVVVGRFMDSWDRHDAHTFAALFSEDADFTNLRGTHVRGRTGVEEFLAPLFTTSMKGTHLTGRLRSVRFLKPDIAMADIDWEMTGAIDSRGLARAPLTGLLDWALTKTGGQWLITVMHNADFTGQAAPAPGK